MYVLEAHVTKLMLNIQDSTVVVLLELNVICRYSVENS